MRRSNFHGLLAWITILLVLSCQAVAIEQIELSIGELQTEFVSAKNIQVHFSLSETGSVGVQVDIAELDLPAASERLKEVHWRCSELQQMHDAYYCESSRLTIGGSSLGTVNAMLHVQYGQPDDWRLKFLQLDLPGGKWSGELFQEGEHWQGSLTTKGIDLAAVTATNILTEALADYQFSGSMALSSDFSGTDNQLQRIHLQATTTGLGYTNEMASQAGEALDLFLELNGDQTETGWQGSIESRIQKGQLYSEPVYLEVSDQPLTFASDIDWVASENLLQLGGVNLQFPGTLEARGEVKLDLLHALPVQYQLAFKSSSLGGLYEVLIQPWLIGTAADSLSLQGGISGSVSGKADGLNNARITLDRVGMEDQNGRFGLTGLQGTFNWRHDAQASRSTLQVEGGHLYHIGFDAFLAEFDVQGDSLALSRPLDIPLLGGILTFQDLQASGVTRQSMQWQMAASLDGVSLAELSESLDWPLLEGTLHGNIPKVYYNDKKLALDGLLTMDVFGGRVTVEGLDILDPLGVVPVMETTMYFSDLDLGQLTRAFSFGRIEGLLEGRVDALQLVGWELNRFHARLATPEGDKSRRRISQRAVDNLTELGNGISANLSQTFLRYFEDFAYERIFLEVDLSQNVAVLDGLPAKGDGYYIVKGRGLPRIDVIGRNRRVAWKDLVTRLKEIQFEDAVVK